MPSIERGAAHQTVITTFEVMPGLCEDLLDLLRDAYREVISRQPGFLGAALHVNDAQTRIANYSHGGTGRISSPCCAPTRCVGATARSARSARASSR